MENDFITSGDLALWENRRGFYGNGCGCDYGCHKGSGKSTTAIGLAAGLGGGALLLAVAGIWGINQASKARSKGNENQINALTNFAFMEHTNRTNWQNQNVPTISNILDIRSGALANATSNAYAQAEAQIVADALTGRSSQCPQKVSLYSAPAPCPCPVGGVCGCQGV